MGGLLLSQVVWGVFGGDGGRKAREGPDRGGRGVENNSIYSGSRIMVD